jgi:hypothetical protein
VLYDVYQIDPKQAPPEPQCSTACHSMPRP